MSGPFSKESVKVRVGDFHKVIWGWWKWQKYFFSRFVCLGGGDRLEKQVGVEYCRLG